MRLSEAMSKVDALIAQGGQYAPRWGWHDDHRENDGKPGLYLPAMQQVLSEFMALGEVLEREGVLGGRMLQLGIGEITASHYVWHALFPKLTVTLDWRECLASWDGPLPHTAVSPGLEIRSERAPSFARGWGAYDFLFIDAGHSFEDVKADHETFGPLVRPGGIIAFHDALRRPGFAEVEVWRYLETLENVNVIGTEVGVAWVRV